MNTLNTTLDASDVQILPTQTFRHGEAVPAGAVHALDRFCWCNPEIVEVPPKTRTNNLTNMGDRPFTEVRHK